MNRVLLVANPAASGFTGGLHRDVSSLLAADHDMEAVWPRSAADARSVATEAAADGVGLVVAMGGDGIVNQVGQGLVGSQTTSLGIIPVGTTNVLARLLHIPSRPKAAAKLLAGRHDVVRQPVVQIVGEVADGPPIRHHALFSVGIGFDAEVVERAEKEPHRKYRFGGLHYARTAIGTAARTTRRRHSELTVTDEKRTATAEATMAQFRDSYTYFGRTPLRFAHEPPDPMHLLVVERLRLRRTFAILRAAAGKGGLDSVTGFHVWRHVHSCSITSATTVPLQADGELLGRCTSVTLTHIPEAISILIPA